MRIMKSMSVEKASIRAQENPFLFIQRKADGEQKGESNGIKQKCGSVSTGAAIHIRMADIVAVLEDTDENERKSRGKRGNGYEGSYGCQYE